MAAKDSGLRVRIERPLREAFVDACRKQDKPAAQVIREFMRGYVAQQASATEPVSPAKWEQQSVRGRNRARR